MTHWVRDTEVWCKYKLCPNYKKEAKRHCCGACVVDDYNYNRFKRAVKKANNKQTSAPVV